MPRVTVEVIVGTMFSGKSDELTRRLGCLQYANKTHMAFKPATDTRSGDSHIVTHDGRHHPAVFVAHPHDILQELEKRGPVDVVGIDEMQFLDPSLIQVVQELVRRGVSVIAAGLDMDYRGLPFRTSADMMAIADSVSKIRSAYCSCGERAIMSQRLVDGLPAPADGPTVEIGGKETYQARCRKCHVVPE